MDESVIYSFIVEWFKDDSGRIEKYKLNFFPCDNSIEMHDLKRNKLFLRRIRQPEIRLLDLYVGGTVNILSRHLCVTNFANDFTAKALAGNSERCVCVISPSGTCTAGKYITSLEDQGFKIINLKVLYLNNMDVRKYFGGFCECKDLDKLTSVLSSGGLIALELMRRDANRVLREVVYGSNAKDNDIFANNDLFMPAQTPEAAAKLAHILFSTLTTSPNRKLLDIKDCTCAVIKPHAVQSYQVGGIWEVIQSNCFGVIAAQVFRLSKVDAGEFLEVYKGVLAEYPELISEFTSGPCVALQVIQADPDRDMSCNPGDPLSVQQRFRELAGPMDPDIARYLRPNTIRAKFGVNSVKNAIHCTDLPEDVSLEVDFFFRILSS
uniref:Non metastatic cells 7 protein expressed n=1 Tax=Echinococcus granulosus TaxID=6210 RepID=A0A068WHC4_ECHGR|nr:non metastatic cells 7 protein expressed [Echinococcus granulosus]